MLVTSREYKVIVDESLFRGSTSALNDIIEDVDDLARSLGLSVAGEFGAQDPKERTILFLDTTEFALRQNGLLLRKRIKRKSGTDQEKSATFDHLGSAMTGVVLPV